MRTLSAVLAVACACSAQEPSADRLIQDGHWKQARTVVRRRLQETPDDPDASFLWSQICNAFGDRSSPLGLAEKAVRLDPGVARFHRQIAEVLGVMAQRAGLFQQMSLARRFRKEIDTALALDPRDVQAQRDLMEFYLLAPGMLGGDFKKAESTAARIAEIDTTEGFLAKARLAEFRKDAEQMEAMLRRAAEAKPPSYKAHMALAQFYLAPEHRNEPAAEAAAKAALDIDGTRSAAYAALAIVYAGAANWSALDATLSSAARAVPDDAVPFYRAAERLLADGRDPARAEQYLRTYLAQEPDGNQPSVADADRELGIAARTLRNAGARNTSQH